MARLLKFPRTQLSFRKLPSPALLALMYMTLIILGTLLLRLPIANNGHTTWIDALFMSTSAVTVTGLVVLDIGTEFTFFGQCVVAILIQLGGLGLMAFAMLLLSALGIPIGMPQRMIVREDLNQTSMANLGVLARRIIVVAVAVEMLGAFALAFVFVPEFGWVEGIWQSVFHSISAFNNAGFSLFSSSLSNWAQSPLINVVVPAMFIVSGLGFVVIGDLLQKRRWNRLSLHTKLMLVGTSVLLVVGTFGFAALEWTNPRTLGTFDTWSGKMLASWFQGVTPRTAGFNTLDTSAMRDETALFTIILMMIGGGSTSTAGGIKVTTFIVLILATIAFFRRRSELHAFGRSIDTDEVMKVLALTVISVILVVSSLFALTILHESAFLPLAFEVVSAFGTVGLSMGETGELTTAGRLIIMAVMFLGRVGPLTLGFFLATRSRPRVGYPAGRIYLG